MKMGRGDKSITVATLRKLLPLWLQVAGFVIDDSMLATSGVVTVDCATLGHDRREAEGFVYRLLRTVTVCDGGVWYMYDERMSVMWIRVAEQSLQGN